MTTPPVPPAVGEPPSDAELASLEALRGASTEEPWAIWPDLKQYGLIAIGNAAGVLETELWTEGEAETVAHVYVEEDAALIVGAVNALPRLVASLLAAMVDPTVPAEQALAWWTAAPTDVVPLHADEWAESPRPLIFERAA